MTDNEIMKALECCIKSTHFEECFENKCPMISEEGCKVGKESLYPYALDLINRQRAEIERLEAENEDLNIYCKDFKQRLKEVTNLTSDLVKESEDLKAELFECVNIKCKARAEAIKEFAERLKTTMEDFARMDFRGSTYYCVGLHHIDNLVKEMTDTDVP